MTVWSAEQVLALAPDATGAAAGRRLGTPAPWSGTGHSAADGALWGLCRGSGSKPYQTVVDLGGPAYKCSCPSRKFPCKHALGLLLLWSDAQVGPAEAPDWVHAWLATRAAKAVPAAPRPPDADAARDRADRRADRVAGGIDELDRWLADQVRTGLAAVPGGGYRHFESVAARMVDAQAPGLAGTLRRLPGVAAGPEGWQSDLLEELALLRLTVTAHRHLDRLPPDLAASVRREVGYPVAKDDVLAGPAVADRWQVLGRRDSDQERISTRRVWLRGQHSGRPALVLSFGVNGDALDGSLIPGTTLDADLHFYPGAAPLRAIVGVRRGEPAPLDPLAGGDLADAARAFAAAVAADPWTWSWPVVLAGVLPVPGEPRWQVRDDGGRRLPLRPSGADLWRLLAVSGGRPVTLAGELTARGLRPLSVVDTGAGAERLVAL
ncbi:MAG TPA: SWIM zinc finger family protein [Mycobacteriales bacterium]|nr:SWIM zinc finger family protein [Mycobacteriales bacterium]